MPSSKLARGVPDKMRTMHRGSLFIVDSHVRLITAIDMLRGDIDGWLP